MSEPAIFMIMNKCAQGVSWLLHPMLMPLYVLFFLFNGDSVFAFLPPDTKRYCYLITVFFLVILPVLSLPVFRYFHLIKDYALNDKQERVYPILATVGAAFVGFWLLGRVAYTNIVQQLFLVLIILLSVFSVITLRWKISMHMTAVGGLCGFLLAMGMKYPGDVRGSFILMLLLAGLLASSRLLLKKHNPQQVYLGFLFGFCCVYGILGDYSVLFL